MSSSFAAPPWVTVSLLITSYSGSIYAEYLYLQCKLLGKWSFCLLGLYISGLLVHCKDNNNSNRNKACCSQFAATLPTTPSTQHCSGNPASGGFPAAEELMDGCSQPHIAQRRSQLEVVEGVRKVDSRKGRTRNDVFGDCFPNWSPQKAELSDLSLGTRIQDFERKDGKVPASICKAVPVHVGSLF